MNPKHLFINIKKDNKINTNTFNNYNNKNFDNSKDMKLPKNILNKKDSPNKYMHNKDKNLQLELNDNNDSKISSKINMNKSQSIYKDEIVKQLYSKYKKENLATNLNLIKNKADLDLYNYSISPPNSKYLLNAKISEIIEPPAKEIFFDKNNIYEKNPIISKTRRNITLRPSLNMQLFYGNFN